MIRRPLTEIKLEMEDVEHFRQHLEKQKSAAKVGGADSKGTQPKQVKQSLFEPTTPASELNSDESFSSLNSSILG